MNNPSAVNQVLDGRQSNYVAGVGSPAVYYWQVKRGDIANLRRRGYKVDQKGFRLCGFVFGEPGTPCSQKYVGGMFINKNGYWYINAASISAYDVFGCKISAVKK